MARDSTVDKYSKNLAEFLDFVFEATRSSPFHSTVPKNCVTTCDTK